MRALAADLRGSAVHVGHVDSGVDGSVKTMVFEGPAGERFRDRMHGVDRRLEEAVARLHDLAGFIDRAAAEVEAAQEARRHAIQLAEEGARQAAAIARAASTPGVG
ncbi:MAG TPA: hypothetical protein VGF23_10315 [Gaiellaceae bacterium]|jgi:hypothetical protein